jgi:hypothetical protein
MPRPAVNLVSARILGAAQHHGRDHRHDHHHGHHQGHHQGHHRDLNLQSAYLHVVADLPVWRVEGIAESTPLVVKVFSGFLSDHVRRRKGLAVLGFALGALAAMTARR